MIPANLATATLRHKAAKHLRLWLVLRELASDGKVERAALDARWRELGFSPVYLRQLLRQGAGVWWKTGTTRAGVPCVFPIGAARVCAALDTDVGSRWIDVPPGVASGALKRLRAHLYTAGLYATERPVTLSRAQISETTGLSRPTQRAAEARCGVRVTKNAMPTPYRTYREMPGGMLGEHWTHPQAAGWFYCSETGTLARRLPSTYSLGGVAHTRRGTVSDGHHSQLSPILSGSTAGTLRRWFYTTREYLDTKASQRAAVCYVRQGPAGPGQLALWEPLIQGRGDANFSMLIWPQTPHRKETMPCRHH